MSRNLFHRLIQSASREPAKAAKVRTEEQKPRLQIVKLEQRIAPGINLNHNETLVREPAKAAKVRTEEPKPKLHIVKLEQRIAPGVNFNHNETLVRDRSVKAQ